MVRGASLLAALIVFGMAFLIVWSSRQTVLDGWKDRVATNASMVSAHTTQAIVAADLVLQSLADKFSQADVEDELGFKAFSQSEAFFQILSERVNVLPQVDVLTAAAPDGTVMNFSRSFPAPSINLADRDYFQAHMSDPALDFFLSQPVQNRGNGKWTFYLARKVRGADQQTIGLLLVGIKVDYFSQYFADTSIGDGYATSLLRADGTLLARHPERSIGEFFGNGGSFREAIDLAPKSVRYVKTPRQTDPSDREGRVVATDRLQSLPLVVLISVTDKLLFQAWNDFALLSAGIAAVIYLILLGLIFQFAAQQDEKAKSLETIGNLNRELVQLNKSLEEKVSLRTRALATANQSLRRMASIDPLTNTANRRTFDLRIKNELALYMRHGVPFALLLLDIDFFKAINDTQGHERGDSVLRELGALLKQETRSSDLAARLGGEEFGIIMSKCEPGDELEFAERLNALIREHAFAGTRITVTIGTAFIEEDDTETALYRRADDALYRGKAAGRDRVMTARPLQQPAQSSVAAN